LTMVLGGRGHITKHMQVGGSELFGLGVSRTLALPGWSGDQERVPAYDPKSFFSEWTTTQGL